MEKLQIVWCDTNQQELENYEIICRAACEQAKDRLQTTVLRFSSGRKLMFEMNDTSFREKVDILIIEPDGGCEEVASTVRQYGYGGLILYLSRSCSDTVFLQAFDAKVSNFVKKGDLDRFATVFNEILAAAEQRARQFVAVSYAGDYKKIDVRDIYYFEPEGCNLINVHYTEGVFTFLSSLAELEERLTDFGFVRIHRGYLVSIDAIHRLSYEEAILNNGKSIPVSRAKYSTLKETMGKWRLLISNGAATNPVRT